MSTENLDTEPFCFVQEDRWTRRLLALSFAIFLGLSILVWTGPVPSAYEPWANRGAALAVLTAWLLFAWKMRSRAFGMPALDWLMQSMLVLMHLAGAAIALAALAKPEYTALSYAALASSAGAACCLAGAALALRSMQESIWARFDRHAKTEAQRYVVGASRLGVAGIFAALGFWFPVILFGSIPWATQSSSAKLTFLTVTAWSSAVVASFCASIFFYDLSKSFAGALRDAGRASRGICLYTDRAGRKPKALVVEAAGILTRGAPELETVFNTAAAPQVDVLRLAAGAEQGLEHPIALAIVEGASQREVKPGALENRTLWPGEGVVAHVDGQQVAVGNRRLMDRLGVAESPLEEQAKRVREKGETVVFVARGPEIIALLGLHDEPKEGAFDAADRLRRYGVTLHMVTGDHPDTAHNWAMFYGIPEERVHAQSGSSDFLRKDAATPSAHTVLMTASQDEELLKAAAGSPVAVFVQGTGMAAYGVDGAIAGDGLVNIAWLLRRNRRHVVQITWLSLAWLVLGGAVFCATFLGLDPAGTTAGLMTALPTLAAAAVSGVMLALFSLIV